MSTSTHPVVDSAKFISEHSKDVTVNLDAVDKLADKLIEEYKKGGFSLQIWKQEELTPKQMTEQALNWIFLVDTLNFCFWSDSEELFTVTHNNKDYTGYWSLCAAINRAVDEHIPILSPSYWRDMTEEQLAHIFRSSTNTQVPQFKERLAVLHEAGKVVMEKFNGRISNMIAQAQKSAQNLIEIVVSNFTSYNDEAEFHGQKVKIYKRVQILVADIWACFEGKSYGEFNDIDSITMFADYRVPQVLAYFGAIEYSSELLTRLREDPYLPAKDPQEIEIRGNSIWSVELVKQKMIEKMKGTEITDPVNAIVIDFYLWTYAKAQSHAMQHIPIHKTRTIFY
jgi:hypothetical protein